MPVNLVRSLLHAPRAFATRIRGALCPPPPGNSIQESRQARLVCAAGLTVAAAALIFSVVHAVLGNPSAATACSIIGFVALGALIIFGRRQQLQRATTIIIVDAIVGLTVVTWMTGGAHSPVIYWNAGLVFIGYVLLRARRGTLVAVAAIANVIAPSLLHHIGFTPEPGPSHAAMHVLTFLSALLLVVCIAAFAWSSERVRARAQEALAARERELRGLVEHSPSAIFMKNAVGRYQMVNGPFCAIVGRRPADILGKTDADLFDPDVADHRQGEDAQVIQSQTAVTFDELLPHAAGGRRHYMTVIFPLRGRDGTTRAVYGIATDVTERRRIEERLRVLSTAVESAANAIVLTDVHGDIQWVNPAFERLTGYGREEVKGKNPRILRSDQNDPAVYQHMWETILAGRVWHGELTNRRRDGSLYTEEMTITPVRDDQGEITHFIAIKNDVTAQRRMEAELRRARDELEQRVAERTASLEAANIRLQATMEQAQAASRAKSEFLANMSHELRTPLNGVIGMTELLLGTALSEPQRRYASRAVQAARTQLSLVDDVLDFSKIEAGRVELEHAAFDLYELVSTVEDTMAPLAAEKKIELRTNLHPSIPRMVIGDCARLQQVLTNLLNNAIKFTNEGTVILRVTNEETAGDHVVIQAAINDTGIGIAPDHLDRLFKPFSQADSSMTRRYGGTGLGLVICKRLVELMGGEVGVISEPELGSTFWVRLSLPAAPASLPLRPPGDLLHACAFVVAAKDESAGLLEQLTSLGIEHMRATAADLEGEGANRLAGRVFDLVVVQIGPVSADNGLVGKIKAHPHLHDVPLLVVLDEPCSREAVFRGHERTARLIWPADRQQLLDAIVEAIVWASADLNAAFEPAAVAAPARHTGHARILVVEDNEIGQEVAVLTLERAGFVCDVAANGRQAVDAFERQAYDLILMDCQMPEMDGFEATGAIRALEVDSGRGHVPIVALTANALQGDRERCLAAGMDDYIAKPVEPKVLIETITAIIHERQPQPTGEPVGANTNPGAERV